MIQPDREKNEETGRLLKEKKETISAAESVTTGLLQYTLGGLFEASSFYQGGITVYNLGQKFKHLQVEPIHASATNCVSEKVAVEMALNVCTLFNSDWGIGITGYASPVPQSNDEVFAYFAIAYRGEALVVKRIDPAPDSPEVLQQRFVNDVMDELLTLLRK